MTTLNGNISLLQQQFDAFMTLFNSNGISRAVFNDFADALDFGTLKERELTSSRYVLDVHATNNVRLGAMTYVGTGFNTSGGIGDPLLLNPDVFGINAALNTITISDVSGNDLLVYKGNISITQMLGSSVEAGSIGCTEFQIGSPGLGQMLVIKGNLSFPIGTGGGLTSGMLSGSIRELSFLASDGQEAYQLTIGGALSPTGTFFDPYDAEELAVNVSSVGANVTGAINSIALSRIDYADANAQVVIATTPLISATGLDFGPDELGALMTAATNDMGPDTTFGLAGDVSTDIGAGTNDWVQAMTVQGDGKIVVAGNFWDANSESSGFAVVRYNSDGSLDTSFAGDGKWTSALQPGLAGVCGVAQVADGKILVGGTRDNVVTLLRFNSDGSPDGSFDGDGVAQASDLGYANIFAVQADGKALIGGGNILFRYTADGVLDTSFGDNGIVSADPALSIGNLFAQADGKVLVLGASPGNLTLTRLNADGSLDTSFGVDGYSSASLDGLNSWSKWQMVRDEDGMILVAGTRSGDNGSGTWTTDIALARFSADGTLDGSFAASGWASFEVGSWIGIGPGHAFPLDLRVGKDGYISLVGDAYGSGKATFVARVSPWGWVEDVGTVDPGLDTNVVGQNPLDGSLILAGTINNDFAVAKLVDSKTTLNQILLSGNDTLTANIETGGDLYGYEGDDTLSTGSGNDRLAGDEGNDTLNSGAGDDRLNGGAGVDSLTGGTGADQFIFDNLASVDTITDFSPTDDTIVLVGPDFESETVPDRAAIFKLSTQALDADDRILYNPATGALSFDRDGSGAAAAVQFATLAGAPELSDANFILNPDDWPILAPDSAVTSEDHSVSIDVKANDYLPDGWRVGGAYVLDGSGRIEQGDHDQLVFTPGDDYQGLGAGQTALATIGYEVYGSSNYSGFALGTLNVTIHGENDAPLFAIGDGQVATSVGSQWSYDQARSVTIQPDGKILVAGDSNGVFAVVRYNADGSLDMGFDGDGKVLTSFTPSTENGGSLSQAYSVALQSDGKILVGGSAYRYTYDGTLSTQDDFALARYNTDGSLDTSFGNSGKVVTALSASSDEGRSVAVQSDGKILLAGQPGNGGGTVLLRYTADGTLDKGFAEDGRLITSLNTSWGSADCELQSDGKILVAGRYGSYYGSDVAVARYDTDGALDTSFGLDGMALAAMSGGDSMGIIMKLQADGKILAASSTYNGGNSDFGVVRFNVDGSLDTSFDGDGEVLTDIGGGNDYVEGMAVGTDGKIVVVGTIGNGVDEEMVLVRYNADGSLDTSFDSDGKVTASASGSDFGASYSVSIQADGKIVVAGTRYDNGPDSYGADFELFRYNADGSLDSTFALANGAKSSAFVEEYPVVLVAGQFNSFHFAAQGAFFDPDGGDVLKYSASKADGTPLPEWLSFYPATQSFSAAPQAGDSGSFQVTVTATDSAGLSASYTRSLTVRGSDQVNNEPTGGITITGIPRQGQTLTVENTLNDVDGIPGSGSGAIRYQWLADGIAISGANGSSYILAEAELGKIITVTASYIDGYGFAESKTSDPTAVVSAPSGSIYDFDIWGVNENHKVLVDLPEGYSWWPKPEVSRFKTVAVEFNGWNGSSQAKELRLIDLETGTVLAARGMDPNEFLITSRSSDTLYHIGTLEGSTLTIRAYDFSLGATQVSLSTEVGAPVTLTLPNAKGYYSIDEYIPSAYGPDGKAYVLASYWDNATQSSVEMLFAGTDQGMLEPIPLPETVLSWTDYLLGYNGAIWIKTANEKWGQPDFEEAFFCLADNSWLAVDRDAYWDAWSAATGNHSVVRDGIHALDLLTLVPADSRIEVNEEYLASLPGGGFLIQADEWAPQNPVSSERWLVFKDGLIVGDKSFNDEVGYRIRSVLDTEEGYVHFQYLNATLSTDGIAQAADPALTVYKIALNDLAAFLSNPASTSLSLLDAAGIVELQSFSQAELTDAASLDAGDVVIVTAYSSASIFDADDAGAIVFSEHGNPYADVWQAYVSKVAADGTVIRTTAFAGEADDFVIDPQYGVFFLGKDEHSYHETAYHLNVETGQLTDIPEELFWQIDYSDGVTDSTWPELQGYLDQPSGQNQLSGQIYHWKSHALLSDVDVTLSATAAASDPTTLQPLFELRNVTLNATGGDLQAELWVNLTAAVGNLDVQLDFDPGMSASFASNTAALPSGWMVVDSAEAGTFNLAAMGMTYTGGSINLGQLTLDLPSGTTLAQIQMTSGVAGDTVSVNQQYLDPYAVTTGYLTEMTAADGVYVFDGVGQAQYGLLASKAVTSAESESAITSADALAALKMAVGLNPNGDASVVSPYQFIAADANEDGRVNSADALAILKMAVNRPDALPDEWLFVSESEDFWNEAANNGQGAFTTTRTSVQWVSGEKFIDTLQTSEENLVAVLKGDVNGDWTAPTEAQYLSDGYFQQLELVGVGPVTQWGLTATVGVL